MCLNAWSSGNGAIWGGDGSFRWMMGPTEGVGHLGVDESLELEMKDGWEGKTGEGGRNSLSTEQV